MTPLAGAVRGLLTQDRARYNAAAAAARLLDRRREREAVDAYLAHRDDARVGTGTNG
jgi:hypothetical protein